MPATAERKARDYQTMNAIPVSHPLIFSTHLLLGLAAVPQAHGCASCGCLLDREWIVQGFAGEPGLQVDMVYTFIDQNQLRSGTGRISSGEVPAGQELEAFTRSDIFTLDLNYVFNPDWSVMLQLPYLVRDHATWGEDHHSYDTSASSGIGDLNLVASYQGFTTKHNLGVKFGLSLPTGPYDETFRSGETLDRGLQPGTGTTGLFVGLYYHDTLAGAWGYFGQTTLHVALNERDHYKPGTSQDYSVGLRYTGFARVTPQFQVNARIAGRDQGDQADSYDSGGSLVYLSPGVMIELTPKINTYVFLQVPVYQNLYGYQLAPSWILSTGIHTSF